MFITLEGGEGSGKSTIALELEKYFEDKGYDVILTREPGGTKLANDIRELIMDNDLDAYEEMLLFNVARVNHLKNVIMPALKDNKVVICDRFIDSSRVYQGILGDLPYDEYRKIEELNDIVKYSENMIDLTLLFDIDSKVGLDRIHSNNRETNRFDDKDLDYHYAVRAAYLQLKKGQDLDRMKIIDASFDPKTVLKQCIYEIELLNENEK